MDELPAAQVVSVSFDVFCRYLLNRFPFLREKLHLQLFHDRVCDFVLNGEDIGQIAIKSLGPKVTAILATNQLTSYSHACPCFPHATFNYKFDAEFAANLLHL